MTGKTFAIVCYVIAGFFFYMVTLLAFFNSPSAGFKALLLAGFSIPAVLALWLGLYLRDYRNWAREVGIVLLSAAGVTTSVALVVVKMLVSKTGPQIPQETLASFSDWPTGCVAIACCGGVGLLAFLSKWGAPPKDDGPPRLPSS